MICRTRIRTLRRPARRRGFTLMEILLVLVILVILGSMVGVFISGARKRAFTDAARNQLNLFKGQMEQYNLDIGAFPTAQQGLQALRQAPADLRNPAKWRGPYAGGDIPADPWGNPYEYEGDGAAYRIWSAGPNGLSEQGGGDDIMIVGE